MLQIQGNPTHLAGPFSGPAGAACSLSSFTFCATPTRWNAFPSEPDFAMTQSSPAFSPHPYSQVPGPYQWKCNYKSGMSHSEWGQGVRTVLEVTPWETRRALLKRNKMAVRMTPRRVSPTHTQDGGQLEGISLAQATEGAGSREFAVRATRAWTL